MEDCAIMEEFLSCILQDFVSDGNNTFHGFVSGDGSFKELLRELANRGFSFCVRRSHKYEDKGRTIYFKMKDFEELDSPFIFLKTTHLQCVYGPKFYNTNKNETIHEDCPSGIKRRTRIKKTKKLDCQVTVMVKKIKMFPDFKVSSGMGWRRKARLQQEVRTAMEKSESLLSEVRYYLLFSGSHNHSISATLSNQVQEFDSIYALDLACAEVEIEIETSPVELEHSNSSVELEPLLKKVNEPVVQTERSSEVENILQQLRLECKHLINTTYFCSALDATTQLKLQSENAIKTLKKIRESLSKCIPDSSELPLLLNQYLKNGSEDHEHYCVSTEVLEPPKKKRKTKYY